MATQNERSFRTAAPFGGLETALLSTVQIESLMDLETMCLRIKERIMREPIVEMYDALKHRGRRPLFERAVLRGNQLFEQDIRFAFNEVKVDDM